MLPRGSVAFPAVNGIEHLALMDGITGEISQGEPGERLQDDRGGGEAQIGQDGVLGHGADRSDVIAVVDHPLEVSNADTGAKQYGRTENMQPFDDQIGVHGEYSRMSKPRNAAR